MLRGTMCLCLAARCARVCTRIGRAMHDAQFGHRLISVRGVRRATTLAQAASKDRESEGPSVQSSGTCYSALHFKWDSIPLNSHSYRCGGDTIPSYRLSAVV